MYAVQKYNVDLDLYKQRSQDLWDLSPRGSWGK